MSPLPLPPLTRRATIGAALAAVAALGACDAGGEGAGSAATTGGSTATGGDGTAGETPEVTPDAEADDALADEVAGRVAAQLAVLGAAADGARWLARPLAPLVLTHEAHAEQLPEVAAVAPPRLGRDPQRLWSQVRATEERLVRELAGAAQDARSGSLARLFASMSAGVAAHLAALPEQPPGRRGGAA